MRVCEETREPLLRLGHLIFVADPHRPGCRAFAFDIAPDPSGDKEITENTSLRLAGKMADLSHDPMDWTRDVMSA